MNESLIASIFNDIIKGLVPFFSSAHNRLYYLHILSSILIALIFFKRKSIKIEKLFNKKYWFNKSSTTDYKLYFFNIILKSIVFTLIPLSAVRLSIEITKFMYSVYDFTLVPQLSNFSLGLIFTSITFLFNDFARFFVHYLMHKIPILWRIHKVHHSATTLTPFTLFRTHPFESIIGVIRGIISTSLATSVFIYLFKTNVTFVDILGVNIIGFIFNISASNLRHSHVYLGFGKLESLIISPAMHQIHHGKESKFIDKNFGVVLSLWDRLFNTFMASKGNSPAEFGIKEHHDHGLISMLKMPFR